MICTALLAKFRHIRRVFRHLLLLRSISLFVAVQMQTSCGLQPPCSCRRPRHLTLLANASAQVRLTSHCVSVRSFTGKQLGRDSALRLLAAIARSLETDGVTLVGAAGLKAVLPLLTQRPEEGNRAAREAAMEVVRVMCTQHGNPRKQNIVRPQCSASCSPLLASPAS